jgi:O-antigen/teichoic acid export membrane protein
MGPTADIDRKGMFKFGLSVMGTRVSEAARSQLFPVLLGSLAGLSASGLYAAARRVTAAPSLVVNAMNQVYNPIASDLYLQERRAELVALTKNMAKWMFSLVLPLFAVAALFPEDILSLFGSSFRQASTALLIMAVGMLFLFGTGPVTQLLIIAGRPRLALADYLLAISMEVGLALVLIPRYGLLGAAVASTVGRVVNNVVPLAQVWRILKLSPYRADYWKPCVAVSVAAVAAKGVTHYLSVPVGLPSTGAAVALLVVAYVSTLVALGLSADDRGVLVGLTGRIKGLRLTPDPRPRVEDGPE